MSDRNTETLPGTLLTKQHSRRGFMSAIGAVGVGAMGSGLLTACSDSSTNPGPSGSSALDQKIINAAATAEALATVMYDNIIRSSPLYTRLAATAADDQAYLAAGREQESIHYNTLTGAGATALTLNFYFPTGMFSDMSYVTTVNTLSTLEEAFIAAYMIGVRDLSTSSLKVLAAQILGIECEHRALARVIANDVGLTSTTGLSGMPSSVVAPNSAANNLAFEQTFSATLATIDDVVTALGPFVTPGSAGYGTTVYTFNPTTNYQSEAPAVTLTNTTP